MRLPASFLLTLCLVLTCAGNALSLDSMPASYFAKRSDVALLPILDQTTSRPPTLQGLTGLVLTNSAYTLPKGRVTIGAALTSEDSSNPDFSLQQVPVTFTMGLADRIEIGAKAQVISLKSGSSSRETGLGDSEIMIKGRIINGDSYIPAVAVGLGVILPTGDRTKGLNEVHDWGAKASLMVSQESLIFGEHFVGAYLEMQAIFVDTVTEPTKPGQDRYLQANAGVLIPLIEDNELQLILEYSRIGKKNNFTLNEANYAAYAPALRYAAKTFSATFGAQYLSKLSGEPENSIRYVAALSRSF